MVQVAVMLDDSEISNGSLDKLGSVPTMSFHMRGCEEEDEEEHEEGLTAPTTAMTCSSHHISQSRHKRRVTSKRYSNNSNSNSNHNNNSHSNHKDFEDDSSWSSMGSDQVNGVVPMKLHGATTAKTTTTGDIHEEDEGMDMFWHRTNSGYYVDVMMTEGDDDEPLPLDHTSQCQQDPNMVPSVPGSTAPLPFLGQIQQWQPNNPHPPIFGGTQPLPFLGELQQNPLVTGMHPHPQLDHNGQPLPYLDEVLQRQQRLLREMQGDDTHHQATPLPFLQDIPSGQNLIHYPHIAAPQQELPFLSELQRWNYQVAAQKTHATQEPPHFAMAWTRNRVFSDTYTMGQAIGEGGFGVVYSCVAKSSDNNNNTITTTATTATDKDDSKKDDTNDKNVVKAVKVIPAQYYNREEIDILQHLSDCPYIVTLQDIFFGFDRVYLVMAAMKGDLLSRLSQKSCYPEAEGRQVIHTLLSAVHFLHTRGVAHRDIKPENVLLPSDEHDTHIQLADFGLAKRFRDDQGNRYDHPNMFTLCGSVWYAAPEVFGRNKGSHEPYDERCDNWSVGVIAYLLLAGYQPFCEARDDYQVVREARKGRYQFHPQYWDKISPAAKDLIASLLKVHPVQRCSLKEALDSDWFKQPQQEQEQQKQEE
ncbi:MAP kinase-activated protein kinase 2 (Fragment) [Seminavis robusta]|uniref:MAP kinase-activated protein kinase 2 n=1 Tax=Seminavis robusta TaxID=568900 RepID=A0A9N8E230_9STRA